MIYEKLAAWLETQDCKPCQGLEPNGCPFTHLLMVNPENRAGLSLEFCCGIVLHAEYTGESETGLDVHRPLCGELTNEAIKRMDSEFRRLLDMGPLRRIATQALMILSELRFSRAMRNRLEKLLIDRANRETPKIVIPEELIKRGDRFVVWHDLPKPRAIW